MVETTINELALKQAEEELPIVRKDVPSTWPPPRGPRLRRTRIEEILRYRKARRRANRPFHGEAGGEYLVYAKRS